eukprot:TRINITY_DN32840_c0_g1_i1.p1 TRINITY_DN32840_c0_g1~~TRINITY_DN32840_c0_g1_i1.p1  ORF type:complete len:469 (+),score=68.44 TRINITY_DN32840_c0_g1_i1:114-1409(+)
MPVSKVIKGHGAKRLASTSSPPVKFVADFDPDAIVTRITKTGCGGDVKVTGTKSVGDADVCCLVTSCDPPAAIAVDVDDADIVGVEVIGDGVVAHNRLSQMECLDVSQPLKVISVGPRRQRSLANGDAVFQKCLLAATSVDSGDDSSSSSSSRSRSRQRVAAVQRSGGAAAGAAIVSATAPLDVDEADRVEEREMFFPTTEAMHLEQEGCLITVMVESGACISMRPLPPGSDAEDGNTSVIRFTGSTAAVTRAASEIVRMHRDLVQTHAETARSEAATAENSVLQQLNIPANLMSAIVGSDGSALGDIRMRCGGIMIALHPSEDLADQLTALIGPGPRESVFQAKRELQERLEGAINDTVRSPRADAEVQCATCPLAGATTGTERADSAESTEERGDVPVDLRVVSDEGSLQTTGKQALKDGGVDCLWTST